ncbi:F-box domain, Leucine-rich repeat domain, L domain-like protein [Artemisia annua]|uniref:F-box domain, Leucine-rich repeat domain, L domain-like protein n=1 Tax=Artemisia annua TaxID=35608 RepID=A0A2U1PB52_ARTAN|nr:F-box domain, Leucine-rich repeat domain, L domain-like protein [Artemisia annua]
MEEDRLTNLPESLQLRILSTLDAQYVVQTSVLSKSWVRLWKSVPILRLDFYDFKEEGKFDKFVEKVLSSQRDMNLDTLIYRRDEESPAMILEKVIHYAFSHNVRHLDIWIDSVEGHEWPVVLHGFGDSLISLRLQSEFNVGCSYLGPLSISLRNLTDLYLKYAVITDQDSFSGFPVLNKLTLVSCQLNTNGKTLKVHAQQLSELSIVPYHKRIDYIELMSPKLKLFKYHGFKFPVLKTCDGLPNLDSVAVAFPGIHIIKDEKRMFDDLMMFFSKVYNVKSLKVCKNIVRILSLFQEELVSRCPPFRDFKFDVEDFNRRKSESMFKTEYLEVISDMKDYLFHKSPAAAKDRILCPILSA